MTTAKGDVQWTRAEERAWLKTLSREQLLGYQRAIPRRVLDFRGQPATRTFREDCALDCQRALDGT